MNKKEMKVVRIYINKALKKSRKEINKGNLNVGQALYYQYQGMDKLYRYILRKLK